MTDKVQKKHVSEDLVQAAIDYCSGNKGADARVRVGFIEGAKWKEEQIIKDAKKGVITDDNQINLGNERWIDLDPTMRKMPAFSFNKGDKVKVIIIKSE